MADEKTVNSHKSPQLRWNGCVSNFFSASVNLRLIAFREDEFEYRTVGRSYGCAFIFLTLCF